MYARLKNIREKIWFAKLQWWKYMHASVGYIFKAKHYQKKSEKLKRLLKFFTPT